MSLNHMRRRADRGYFWLVGVLTLALSIVIFALSVEVGSAASIGRGGGSIGGGFGRGGAFGSGSFEPASRGGSKSTGSRQGRRDENEEEGVPFGKFAPYLDTAETLGALGAALGMIAWSVVAVFKRGRRKHEPIRRDTLSTDELQTILKADQTIHVNEAASSGDVVELSAFAPPVGREGEDIFVQLFLHKGDETNQVEIFAKSIDTSASARGKATLITQVRRGDRVDLILEGPPSVSIDEPHQFLIWRGEARSCQFIVSLPRGIEGRKTIHFRARVLLASIPIGDLAFPLIVSEFDEAPSAELLRGSAVKKQRAFLSYASGDRAEVLKRAQALKVARVEFFQDLLDLELGERWERRLYEEIDRCDLFLLFWSFNASHSQWVMKEAKYALERQKTVGEQKIEITPVILEGPPIATPPEELKAIHFGDAISYVIAGAEAEDRPSKVKARSQAKRTAVKALTSVQGL